MEMLAKVRANTITKWKVNTRYRTFLVVAAVCLPIGLCLLFFANYRPQIKDEVYFSSTGEESRVKLPYEGNMGTAPFSIRFKLAYRPFFTPAVYQMIGDDEIQSITINNRSYSFSDMLLAGKKNDWMKGFSLDLAGVLKVGDNNIQVYLNNLGGSGGLRINTSSRDPEFFLVLMVFCLVLCVPGYLFLRKWTGNKVIPLILCLAFLIRVVYSCTVTYIVRGYDAWGHLAYFEYVAEHFALPPGNMNWQTYQPPLYYILAAFIFKVGIAGGLLKEHCYTLLAWFAIFLQMIFLSVSARVFINWCSEPGILPAHVSAARTRAAKKNLLTVLIKPENLATLAIAVLSFWPSGIIHAARVGNDVLYYPLAALAIWFLSAWYTNKRWKELVLTFVFATLALLTKGNAVLLFITIFLLIALHWVKSRFSLAFIGRVLLISLIFCAGAFITFHDSFANLMKGAKKNFLVPSADILADYVMVGNHAGNYLYLDLKAYLTEPYAEAYSDRGGRQYFWNYLLKTSLLGEFTFAGALAEWCALIMALLLLLMIIFLSIGNGLLASQLLMKRLDMLFYTLICVFSSLAFRISIPAACSNDFRYIFPVLIPFCFFYARGLGAFVKAGYKKTAWAGLVMAGLFIVCSLIFYIDLFVREG